MDEGVVISIENIKPSFPTPLPQKTHNLSLLDQIIPPIYIPLVLYYPNLNNHNYTDPQLFILQTTKILKKSLSSTLTRFYPLAGTISDHLSVDCNDHGVPFVVAKFKSNLSDFLKCPNPEACRSHIPSPLTWTYEPGAGANVAMIQASFFDCGGVAIGVVFLHKVADGTTISAFIKAWSEDAERVTLSPVSYHALSLFPSNEILTRESHLFSVLRPYFKFGKTVMKRYVFDASAVAKLRAALSDGQEGRVPTRVESVSALLWKCFMVASAAARGHPVSMSCLSVNLRRRAEPQFPDHSFGNFIWLAPVSSNNDESSRDLKHLFEEIRRAITKVDSELVERMQGEDGFSGYCKNVEETLSEFQNSEKVDFLSIISWCNFGLYSVDFGFGQAAWISKCDAGNEAGDETFLNSVWLMDTRSGDGVEAWVTLEDNYFVEFDKIQEIRDFALVDPVPWEDNTFLWRSNLINSSI